MKEGHLRVSMQKVQPNGWNPNEMDAQYYEKLKTNLIETRREAGRIPPIIVRPNKKRKCYEIIDGYHRWTALQELGDHKINVFSLKVNDKTARVLTNNLNYLRGTANREKYARGIVELMELGATQEDLARLLPETEDDIDQLLSETDISIKALEQLDKEASVESERDLESIKEEIWVDMKFRVTAEQAAVIEKEIARIASLLKGKKKRSRAIEYMAVMSSHNELPEGV